MDDTERQAARKIACPQCGHTQASSGVECEQCGFPLHAPTQIYRREADGSWTAFKAIDLTSIAPNAPRLHGRVEWRRIALIAALLVLPGIVLVLWSRALRVEGIRLERSETAAYLQNPVGQITPHLQVRYQRDGDGRLKAEGEINLPDQTVLAVSVYDGQDLVAVDYPVRIERGHFTTRSLLEKGKPFAEGTFQLHIAAVFDDHSQPASVLLVVGPLGERLQGRAVSWMPGTGAAKMELVEDFVLGP